MQPLHLVKVTKGKLGSDETSPKTLSQRYQEVEHVRNLVSGGCSVKLLAEEVRVLTSEERQLLLTDAGFRIEIAAEQGLAMKADLSPRINSG